MTASRPGPRRTAATFTERARRRQIIDSTIELISVRGYTGTSLSAIAEAAGISKAAVLYHFSSKDNLTEATLQHVFEQYTAYVMERVERAADAREAVLAYVRAMISYSRDNRRHIRLITEVLLDDKGGTRLKAPGSHEAGGRLRGLADLLAAGQEAGLLRDFDTTTIALAIGGAIDGVVSQWLADPELDLDAATEELESFVILAIDRRAA
ncbi:TetR family transcriptional regulator [Saccharopolyspora erythraea NRRL 2338]|uniref:TetR-family transcriptional regulator n=2 Tax=Saccharopolyspora erythraea TaxID=1836 RepID=A4FAW1_SACEN|nr:TetR family transcriptional regulator [Saccharopolyspora erythraea]EQD87579.1 TetR family transcriptional regulator [Saccharopolyspora erythraea D]PFG94968.1 TetR family transcriptional regulator [Saccharopolyspora erythraea NRRL 2338]QRK91660.1 TetR family transcriptional regulator [Saccharopolyspora erythraea]CAM01186.1 TetR-family transcriptional regulator [Saccharopolyspora erythraea NRRL 2338]